jgi:hypothetical protein
MVSVSPNSGKVVTTSQGDFVSIWNLNELVDCHSKGQG